jgi:cation:H+ antiporter
MLTLRTLASAGTSPLATVTLGAVLRGESGLAVGNVVGSNIANVLMILGASALILPLVVKLQRVRVDIPFMTAFSVRPELHGYTTVMMWFVTPLVVLTVVSTVFYELGRRKAAAALNSGPNAAPPVT